ncbi:ROK family transcriptional regulator [Pedobacter sp. SYP-B3415]|uniref:ROK family transcriptional regulator n=1 Tax=Pedobacter sp. SYP-B3415 TaxID=2496641 RepID=UPI00101C4DC3|nr:ROK family transcriptional regulator [Pedobacter sp. SYP-B3415]
MSVIIEKNRQLKRELIVHLYHHESLSLNELSKLTGKSLPLITSAVNELVSEGYVIDKGLAPSSGGRRPVKFFLNPEKNRYIVAVAIDQMLSRLVIYDLFNTVKFPEQTAEINLAGNDESLNELHHFIDRGIKASGIVPEEILGIGIGMPGFVDIEKGVNYSFFPTGTAQGLRDYLEMMLGLPVMIDNDSSLIALAEFNFGAGRNESDILVVNIGWGTGLGMILNGSIFRGSTGFAGEFSHIPLSDSNNLCSCGKRGCLEVETSLLVMVHNARAKLAEGAESKLQELFGNGEKSDGDHFLEAARAGDPLAVSILSDAAFLLGKGISTLIHILNPRKIILSGRGAVAGKIFLPPIHQAINEFCIPRLAEQTQVSVSAIAENAELVGAANLVIENCEFN